MPKLIAVFVLILTGLTYLGVSGFAVPLTDFLSSFLWHFVFASAVLAIFAIFYRSYLLALFTAFLAVLSIYQATSYPRITPQPGLSAKPQDSYSIMTFNTWRRSSSEKHLIEYLRESKPDFVFLQEITASKFEEIKELHTLYPHMNYCAEPLCSLLFISRHPWKSIQAGRAGPGQLPLIDVVFGPKFKNLRFVLVHTSRPHQRYTTHRDQLEWLGEKLAQIRDPLVTGGDINSPPFASPVQTFASISSLKPVGSYLTTWPQRTRHLGALKLPFMQFGLDQFLASEAVKPMSVERGPDFGSDHRPVTMRFQIAGEMGRRFIGQF